MQEVDQGHLYKLDTLDNHYISYGYLKFVKRVGDKFPGNKPPAYSGTTLQEVLRACRLRLIYLDKQRHHWINPVCIRFVCLIVFLLEYRAARRHHRSIPTLTQAINGPFCGKCLHAGCQGVCH